MNLNFIVSLAVLFSFTATAPADERSQHFDKDPGWEAVNNRPRASQARTVRQDFGYSAATSHAGGAPGEVGGVITAAAETAYYGKKIEAKSFKDSLRASGRIICKSDAFHATLGFFNSESVNEWRTPNTIAIRLLGRGDVFYAYVEYCTCRWRAGADTPGGFATVREEATGRLNLRGFKRGVPMNWSLKYDPEANKGGGSITATVGEEKAICHLDEGHKADGATFNRFGLMPIMKSADDSGEIYIDDVEINGVKDDFARDPGWEGVNNRRSYQTLNIRPVFDFGFSKTQHADGQAAGELGGLVFRGDCRYPDKLAAYGDRLEPLTLDKPLKASGKIALRRAVSDSTVLLGFYHSKDSLKVTPSQESGFPRGFLGIAVEGPSRDGFFVYPAYRLQPGGQGYADGPKRPHIMPDGQSHDWSMSYDPDGANGRGRITVTMDGKTTTLDLGAGERVKGATFDRFGIVTTWIDGNGQNIYFDDLTYTWRQ